MTVVHATPKLLKNHFTYSESECYHYYAGFSDTFVKEIFEKYCIGFNRPIILDPWNGAGTTTLVATMLGYDSYGFDINPVMVIISKAKLYKVNKDTINRVMFQIENAKNRVRVDYQKDPLSVWFTVSAVSAFRKLEYEIQKLFFKIEKPTMLIDIWNYVDISYEVSFFYLVLFSIIKEMTKTFKSSNPTWIKSNIDDTQKISISYKKLKEIYCIALLKMQENFVSSVIGGNCQISLGNSQHITLNDNSIDVIVTSPPYCTRIDYVIYTQVELSLLGYSREKLNLLRNNMIGTPTIMTNAETDDRSTLSRYCLDTLELIKSHQSKAAKSYYYKTYYQYFVTIDKSISELNRVLKKNGIIILVVQDSWFKDIHINLSYILLDLCKKFGLKRINKIDFDANNNMNYINSESSKYIKTRSGKESVLVLRKE